MTERLCASIRNALVPAMMAACFAGLTPPAARAQDCMGRIVSIEEAAANYNPFSPVAHRSTFGVTIENTGSDACRYFLAAKDAGHGGDFSFQIASAGVEVLIAGGGLMGTSASVSSRELAPGETQRLELTYSLPGFGDYAYDFVW